MVDVISSGSAVPAGTVTSRYSGSLGAGASATRLFSRGGSPTAGAFDAELLYEEFACGAGSVRDVVLVRGASRRPVVARGAVVCGFVRAAELSAVEYGCGVSVGGAGATV